MKCHTEQVFTNEVTIKLRNFGLAQQELCRELLEAKHLGICKITTLANGTQSFKSLDSILKNSNVSMKTDIILTREKSKEMSLSTLNEQGRML